MRNYNASLISSQRGRIMGFAILWIALFHSPLAPFPSAFSILRDFISLGNIGVDVFLFVSGVSLYFSFHANRDIPRFYLRRLKRILLPTLIVMVPLTLYRMIFRKTVTGILSFLLEVTGFCLFTDGTRTIWFIAAIILLYFLYPILFGIFQRTDWSKWTLFSLLLVSLLVNLILRITVPTFWFCSEIFFRRVPIFLIGAYWGKAVYDKRELSLRYWQIGVLALVLCGVCAFWNARGLSQVFSERYLYAAATVPITMLLSILPRWNPLDRILGFFGNITLEFYLTHEFCIIVAGRLLHRTEGLTVTLLAYTAATVTAKLLSLLCAKLQKTVGKP